MKKPIKQRNYFLLSVLILFIFSCNSKNDARKELENFVETSEIINEGYEKVAADLYKDTAGTIYFKTIDRSAIDAIKMYYNPKLIFDTIINGDTVRVEKEIKHVVDVETFVHYKKVNLTTFYKDKNHHYYHREQADGGILHCFK
ncbi:MAG: hypothetical protein ACK46Y_17970 [Fluviicola sp.]